MRTPDQAALMSPDLHAEIHTEIPPIPNSPNVQSPHRLRRIGAMAAGLAIAAAALPLPSPASADPGNSAFEARTAATTYVSGNAYDGRLRALPSIENLYNGHITLRLEASRPNHTKTATQTSSLSAEAKSQPSTAVTIATSMGISAENLLQGKKAAVKIAGQRINLANYVSDERTAQPWYKSRDCLWNWAKQDLLAAAKAAGLDESQTQKLAEDGSAITAVMNGYVRDNPQINNSPRRYLNAGVTYKTTQARQAAEGIAARMKPAPAPVTNPAPENANPPTTKAESTNNQAANLPSQAPEAGRPGGEYSAPSLAERIREVEHYYKKFGAITIGGMVLLFGVAGGIRVYRKRRGRGHGTPYPVMAEQNGWSNSPANDTEWEEPATQERRSDTHINGRRKKIGRHRLDSAARKRTEDIANSDVPTDVQAQILSFLLPVERKPPLRGRGMIGGDGYIGVHRKPYVDVDNVDVYDVTLVAA